MKLPNGEYAVVQRRKSSITCLTWNIATAQARHDFSRSSGSAPKRGRNWPLPCEKHGCQNEVSKTVETGFGPLFEVEGDLTAPDGRRPRVCSVWQLDQGETLPRLITAYPLEANE